MSWLNSKKIFKILIFKPKLSFLRKNHKNDNKGWMFTISLLMNLAIFLRNGYSEDEEFALVIIFVICHKNYNQGLKMKILKFHGI